MHRNLTTADDKANNHPLPQKGNQQMSVIFERTTRMRTVMSQVQSEAVNKRIDEARMKKNLLSFELYSQQIDIAFERNVINAMKNKALPKNFYTSISEKIGHALSGGERQGLMKLDAGFGFAHWRATSSVA
jgi:hypothetical protein